MEPPHRPRAPTEADAPTEALIALRFRLFSHRHELPHLEVQTTRKIDHLQHVDNIVHNRRPLG